MGNDSQRPSHDPPLPQGVWLLSCLPTCSSAPTTLLLYQAGCSPSLHSPDMPLPSYTFKATVDSSAFTTICTPHGASQAVLEAKNPPTKAGAAEDVGSIPGWGGSPGEGHGNPLQYSCLENPHGQRRLAGYSSWGHKELDSTDATWHGLILSDRPLCVGLSTLCSCSPALLLKGNDLFFSILQVSKL